MADAALDNDVILKGASYGLLSDLLAALPEGPYEHGVLGAARFMLPKTLKRKSVTRMGKALADLQVALKAFEVLEPDKAEQRLAAELQFNAQQAGLALDPGEAQLTAIVVSRGLRHLLTGDKRAILALASTPLPDGIDREQLVRKVICLEQAVLALLDHLGAASVRALICAEHDVDVQLRVCFSCSSPEIDEASWREGLRSAIEAIRVGCSELLSPI
ncbi:type II toxin-antitoxin system VapC family toxin [[Pseudomonas] boreopolis]|uniref:type II toxin-antitoxin system VapC family toxin n=1 Tax=Xanthomonas boreopolis TaxID=86183 RepID=UPI003D9BDEF9